ncbi:MAG: rod shape-determining protein MreC, partial [Oligoflexia bacterium]|nr:rod shape-determining protein MreC [Oligoflexia bacterium]
YLFLIKVNQDNRMLMKENQDLKQKINQLIEVEYENSRLRRLLLFKERISPFMIPAQVIAKDVTVEFRSIRINKGKKNGIKIAMPVVNYEGIVGQVIRVGSSFSDVLIVTDPNFAVDTLVQRSRARGIVEGRSSSVCRLKYLERLDDVQMGDQVITSGLAGRFPKGILIGEVISAQRKNFGITQNVELHPSVNFDKLEEVFVIVRN